MAEPKSKTPKVEKPETDTTQADVAPPVSDPAATPDVEPPAAEPAAPAESTKPLAVADESAGDLLLSEPAILITTDETVKVKQEPWAFYGLQCTAAVDVLKERCRQVMDKGHDTERDDACTDYQLPRAAVCYAIKSSGLPPHRATLYWPFNPAAFKPANRRVNLVKAAALLLAEIERLDRAELAAD